MNATNGNVAIAANNGSVYIRSSGASAENIKEIEDSGEWIEAMAFSPDGTKLAVGSHDNNVYVYDASTWEKLGTLSSHNSFIVSVDWDVDSKYLRTICGAHELLFFNVEEMKQDPSGASNTKDSTWATGSNKYGWYVQGIFPSGTDGTHINGVAYNPAQNLIACGDDYGLVTLFRSPALTGAKPISLRGHSEHVVRVAFCDNGDIISVGGQDKTIMHWKC